MWAAVAGVTKSVEILVQNGADIHHTNTDTYTPLLYAAKHGKSCILWSLQMTDQ